MTTLRDPFANVHKKDIKNKQGQVVAQVDYVGWSQAADRLDEVCDDWTFQIMGIGEDWVHGRLTINGRPFENIGYAENADMDWKKEVLKDAASDAFKRCAALAGVARYFYDKDSHQSGGRVPSPARPPARPDPYTPRPVITDTVPEEPPDLFPPIGQPQNAVPTDECPIHHEKWRGDPGDLYHGPKGVVDGGYCRHPDNVKRTARRAS